MNHVSVVENKSPTGETYKFERGVDYWRCFHCGEKFTTPGGAADHFGAPDKIPGCLLKVEIGNERGWLMEIRKLEKFVADACNKINSLEEEVIGLELNNESLKRVLVKERDHIDELYIKLSEYEPSD